MHRLSEKGLRRNIILFIISCWVVPVMAQENKEEVDPFEDYSYLWEKPKKEKSKKSKKKKEQYISIDTFADSTQIEDYELQFQDSLGQIAKGKKISERKEKDENMKPAEDFRAGLPPMNVGSAINAGFTYTLIDGNAYVGMTLAPELNFGKVGVGIDVPILYGLDDKSFRTEMFEDGVGVLRLVRYVRIGQQKVDPVYVKIGILSGIMIGYGGLVNNYTNSISYEKRRIGLHYDVNYKGWGGIEGMYNDLNVSSLNLLVIRPYIKPFKWLPIPIVHSLEIGMTFIKDKDQTSQIGQVSPNDKYKFTKDGIGAFGIDAGITLLQALFIQIDFFGNYSKLNMTTDALRDSIDMANTATLLDITSADFKNGDGYSYGLNFRFHFIADLVSTDIRIERLSYSDHYQPQFFDASYEINKDRKIYSLTGAEKRKGFYGSLTGHILKKISLGGSLMLPDDISASSPATVSLHADVDRLADKISIHGAYFKGGLTDLSDAFGLDERSLTKVRFSYHMNKFLVMGVDYFWSYTSTENGFETTQYVSPFFGLSISF